MKMTGGCMALVLILVGMITGGVGCASGRVNLVDQGLVTVERIDPETSCISRPTVYQNGDELVISGKVKCTRFRGFSLGHIDIAIVSAEGGLLQSLSVLYYPRIIPRKGGRESRFQVSLPLRPPKGTVVRLAFHKTKTPSVETYHCDDNAAIAGR